MPCPHCAGEAAEVLEPYLGTHAIFRRMGVARCAGCGLVYATPQPTAEELTEYYRHYWDGEVAVSTPSTRRYYLAQSASRVDYLRRHGFPAGPRPAVLDVGAGLGLFHDGLALRGITHDFHATETDGEQLAGLKGRFGDDHAATDISGLPAGATYDLLVLSHVLEHMADPHGFLAAILGRLNPGGLLLVEVPNGDYRYKNNFESHLLFFAPETLRALLARHGEVVDVSTVGAPAASLRITQVHPEQGLLRPLKELVKTVIATLTPAFTDAQIARYGMSDYGGDRQWLRALLRKPG
ncbi:MAG: class I SAM-dependent methyltransferase [Rhodocyclaceae bacterium]|nr:class I SAM-dependent methyltransferase [Rhodocyclaceae bacterium]